MGMMIACDGCGIDVQYLDRFHLQAASLERGTIQADLCPTCAEPFWKLPVGEKLVKDAADAMAAEQVRRAAIEEQWKIDEAQKIVAANQE